MNKNHSQTVNENEFWAWLKPRVTPRQLSEMYRYAYELNSYYVPQYRFDISILNEMARSSPTKVRKAITLDKRYQKKYGQYDRQWITRLLDYMESFLKEKEIQLIPDSIPDTSIEFCANLCDTKNNVVQSITPEAVFSVQTNVVRDSFWAFIEKNVPWQKDDLLVSLEKMEKSVGKDRLFSSDIDEALHALKLLRYQQNYKNPSRTDKKVMDLLEKFFTQQKQNPGQFMSRSSGTANIGVEDSSKPSSVRVPTDKYEDIRQALIKLSSEISVIGISPGMISKEINGRLIPYQVMQILDQVDWAEKVGNNSYRYIEKKVSTSLSQDEPSQADISITVDDLHSDVFETTAKSQSKNDSLYQSHEEEMVAQILEKLSRNHSGGVSASTVSRQLGIGFTPYDTYKILKRVFWAKEISEGMFVYDITSTEEEQNRADTSENSSAGTNRQDQTTIEEAKTSASSDVSTFSSDNDRFCDSTPGTVMNQSGPDLPPPETLPIQDESSEELAKYSDDDFWNWLDSKVTAGYITELYSISIELTTFLANEYHYEPSIINEMHILSYDILKKKIFTSRRFKQSFPEYKQSLISKYLEFIRDYLAQIDTKIHNETISDGSNDISKDDSVHILDVVNPGDLSDTSPVSIKFFKDTNTSVKTWLDVYVEFLSLFDLIFPNCLYSGMKLSPKTKTFDIGNESRIISFTSRRKIPYTKLFVRSEGTTYDYLAKIKYLLDLQKIPYHKLEIYYHFNRFMPYVSPVEDTQEEVIYDKTLSEFHDFLIARKFSESQIHEIIDLITSLEQKAIVNQWISTNLIQNKPDISLSTLEIIEGKITQDKKIDFNRNRAINAFKVFLRHKIEEEKLNGREKVNPQDTDTPASQPGWSLQEAAILLDAYLKIQEEPDKRKECIQMVSDQLRQMAINQGMQISDKYRNLNGISFQMSSMETAWTGRDPVGHAHSTKVFDEIVRLYRNERNEFERLLREAKKLSGRTLDVPQNPIITKKGFQAFLEQQGVSLANRAYYCACLEHMAEEFREDIFEKDAIHCADVVKRINGKIAAYGTTSSKQDALRLFEKYLNEIELLPPKALRESCYRQILKDQFPSGFKLNSFIFTNRFKNSWQETYPDIPIDNDEEIKRMIQSLGIVDDKMVYLPEAVMSEDQKLELLSYLKTMADNGEKGVYYQVIFDDLAALLVETQISTVELLKKYLQHVCTEPWTFHRLFVQFSSHLAFSPSDEVRNYLRELSMPDSYQHICEVLATIPPGDIKWILIHEPDILYNAGDSWFQRDIIELKGREWGIIRDVINRHLKVDEYILVKDLYRELPAISSSIGDQIQIISSYGFQNLLKWKFASSFSFNGNVISYYSNPIDIIGIFKNFAKRNAPFQYEDLKVLADELDKGIYFDSVFTNCIRISKNDYVRKDSVHFDVENTDAILDQFCPGKYIPLRDISAFHLFPSAGVPWNIFLLEQYVYQYSKKFRLVHSGFSADMCSGAIVRVTAGIVDFKEDLVPLVLAESDILLAEKDALKYLAQRGLIYFTNIKISPQMLQKARLLRQNRQVQKGTNN